LINESFASRFLPGTEAIGQRLAMGGNQPLEIIGVVANVMNEDMDDPAEPHVYFPFAQSPVLAMTLVIRAESSPTQVVGAVRDAVAALDPNQPVSNIKTMHQVIEERSSSKRLMTWMLAIFALIALLLAAVGIYAVMSYVVAQRTHEIGVRMALGAEPRDIFRLVVGQGAILITIGVVLGLGGAFVLTRAMAEILYGVTVTDPITFIAISLLLASVALLACYVPARRATRVDPMVALRYE
ncbi:MAG TPA: FtsX-like permease family protein, partial [Blastocatellia bacterium]|nr:FtsX-like permease family protein [Blastocatellia bacterium]